VALRNDGEARRKTQSLVTAKEDGMQRMKRHRIRRRVLDEKEMRMMIKKNQDQMEKTGIHIIGVTGGTEVAQKNVRAELTVM
jgi:hypothetical protein